MIVEEVKNPEDIFALCALAEIPKILTLLDRNQHSPTFGCFDRLHWHYKVTDFPSGMSQEFVWPLALCYSTRFPELLSRHMTVGPQDLYQNQVVKEWGQAGIEFAARSAHPDGSCDDYFPFERADGAAAFSLLAFCEAYRLLSLNEPDLLGFFEKRANLLARSQETGRLTNHQALIALAMSRLGELVGTDQWRSAIASRIDLILQWQSDEGWFPEYDGFDPGYHTLTIWCLAELQRSRPNEKLKQAIRKAVNLAADFVHPDGSFGGEYGSRNTYNYFPAGFEVVGTWLPSALAVNDRFIAGLRNQLGVCYSDDRIIGHHTWNYLLAYRGFVAERDAQLTQTQGRKYYEGAGLLVDRREPYELYLSTRKGGVLKLFKNDTHVLSDTGWSVVLDTRTHKNAVSNLFDEYVVHIDDETIRVSGALGFSKTRQMTPVNSVLLRIFMLTVGRLVPNLVRSLLQGMLVSGKRSAPFQFVRCVCWEDEGWVIEDEISGPWSRVSRIALGRDQTSNYNVMSRTFQRSQLAGWTDLTEKLKKVKDWESLKVRRTF